MPLEPTITREMIEAAATAILTLRFARSDAPLSDLTGRVTLIMPQAVSDVVVEEAEAALRAALAVAPGYECAWDDATRLAINTDAEARIAALEASLPFAISRHLSTICSHLLGLYDASDDPKVRELAVAIRANTAEAGEAFVAALGASGGPGGSVSEGTRDDVKCRCVGTFGPDPECGACGGSGCVGGLGDLGDPEAARRNRSAMMRLFASPAAPTPRGDR